MKYLIVSPRVGTPGDEYQPRPGVNVEALLAMGAIRKADKVSTPAQPKSAKTKSKKPKE